MIDQDHLLSSYGFDLPPELIAQRPASPRDESRLFVYDEDSDTIEHKRFVDLPNFLPQGSRLVLNQSKVYPCRLFGHKATGSRVEVFILSVNAMDDAYPCLIKSSKKKKVGDHYSFMGDIAGTIVKTLNDGTFLVKFNDDIENVIERAGQVPIPPYIRDGHSDAQDLQDYQTLFAKHQGSVAAPTAGLHFTQRVFSHLESKDVLPRFVTLHVGLGTFAPVKTDHVLDHKMHSEKFFVAEDQWHDIIHAPKRFAVGTTSLRVLESLWPNKDQVTPGHTYETDIFLHPGKKVHSIHGLITNFHLPESTLLMLVSSLIGREKTLQLYNVAIKERYRFFSYGDAMLIIRKEQM